MLAEARPQLLRVRAWLYSSIWQRVDAIRPRSPSRARASAPAGDGSWRISEYCASGTISSWMNVAPEAASASRASCLPA